MEKLEIRNLSSPIPKGQNEDYRKLNIRVIFNKRETSEDEIKSRIGMRRSVTLCINFFERQILEKTQKKIVRRFSEKHYNFSRGSMENG